MAERRGIMCGCFWSQSTGWRINFFCSVTHSGRAVGYDAGQTRSWFARIDFYIRFLFSLMTSLFHNINRTWSRRRVSRGESNGSARLLDWSPPYNSSRVLVLPPHFPLMDTQTDVFFSSYQISWPFVLTSSAAQHSPRQSVLSSFLRPFHPIILFDGTSGRMLCDRSGPSLRQRSRANKSKVALQTRSTSSWRIAIPPASGVISLVYQRDSNKSKYRICGLRFECWRHSEVAVLRPRQQKRKFNLRRKFGRALFSLLISDTFHSA